MALQVRPGEDGISQILFDKGTLFHLYVGRWTANKKMTEADLLLTPEDVDKDAIYIGHKKLLPKEAQERLQWIEGQARSFVNARSLPFPIGHGRFVSFKALRGVLDRLRRYKAEWDEAVMVLLANYARYKDEQLERLDAQVYSLAQKELAKVPSSERRQKREELDKWEDERKRVNRELYPPTHELRNKFEFSWRMYQASPIEGVGAMGDVDAETIIEERERIQQDYRQWVREASVAMHRELGQAAANARRLLADNGKLNPKNLRPLFEAFETFSAVNFAGTSDFQNTLDSIRSRYLRRTGSGETDWALTAEQVNGSTDEMHQLLGQIADLAVEETAEAAGVRTVRSGVFGRMIEL